MAFDQHTNFAYSTVQSGSGVIGSTSGTTINIVNTGDLPDPGSGNYNVTVWPAGVNPTRANAEIMRVTAKSSTTLTVTRAQEATTALATIASGYQVALAMTAKLLTDIEAAGTGGGGSGAGTEIGYDRITSNATVSSTTQAAGSTIIACAAHTFDGSPVMFQFFAPWVNCSAAMGINLFEGSTQIGSLLLTTQGSTTFPLSAFLRFTPSAGSHTYTVTGYVNSGSGTINAGAGGTATAVPAFARFTKV